MNKLIIASAAFLALAGSAVAQEVPGFYGVNPYAQTVDGAQADRSYTVSGQASATVSGAVTGDVTGAYIIHLNQNYSGK